MAEQAKTHYEVIVVGAGVAGIYQIKRLSDLGKEAGANAALSFADRDVAGGNSVLADQLLAYEANSIIPPDASYRLVIGPRLTKQASLPTTSVPGWLRYFLMPRRQDDSASWVVCYGCDPAGLGARYEPLWSDPYGISVGKLGR